MQNGKQGQTSTIHMHKLYTCPKEKTSGSTCTSSNCVVQYQDATFEFKL